MTYELTSRLSTEAAMQRIQALFAKEGVECRTADLSVTSVRTPIAFIGFQPRLYSRRNWVGLNPFTFVSGVDVRCQSGEGDAVRINVHINQLRAFIWVAFWAACSFLASLAMPQPEGAILFIGVTVAAWFVLVWFLGGFLIKKEICDCVDAGSLPFGPAVRNERTD